MPEPNHGKGVQYTDTAKGSKKFPGGIKQEEMELAINPGILILAICFGAVTVITWAPMEFRKKNKDRKNAL